MNKKFKSSDIVKLITGTQKMKVKGYFTDIVGAIKSNYEKIGDEFSVNFKRVADNKPKETTLVICEWYDHNNNLKTQKFEEADLE